MYKRLKMGPVILAFAKNSKKDYNFTLYIWRPRDAFLWLMIDIFYWQDGGFQFKAPCIAGRWR